MKNYSGTLRNSLKKQALTYAILNNVSGYIEYNSAIIFDAIGDNFQLESYQAIVDDPDWAGRLEKKHQKHIKAKELQSSNSSDDLLMNVFCNPKIKYFKGIAKLFGENKISTISFGHKPMLLIDNKPESRSTEIDMVINNNIYCEAKLTEKDFTRKKRIILKNMNSSTNFLIKHVCLKPMMNI